MTHEEDVRRQRVSWDEAVEDYKGLPWTERVVFAISVLGAVVAAYAFALIWFSLS